MINPTLADVILGALDSFKLDLHGPMIGIVKTYYPGTVGQAPAVDVQPVVQRAIPTDDDTTEPEALPVIPNVPLVYPRGGGAGLSFDLVPGDPVLLIVLWLDVTQWRLTGAPIVSPTVDQGSHHIAHCVAIPGIVADAGIPMPNPTAALNLFANGATITLDGSGTGEATIDAPSIKLGANAVNAAADATKVHTELLAIKGALASVSAGGGGPISYNPGSVAAVKVKVE